MGTISQRTMRTRHIRGKAGMLAVLSNKRNLITTATNADPQARMNKTLTIDTFTLGAVYTTTIEGRVLTYTALVSDVDQTGVALAFAGVINADPQVRGIVQATPAAAVIALAGLLPGLAFSASESDAKMTLANVNAEASAAAIPFGRAVFYAGDSVYADDPNKLAKLPEASDLSGAIIALTPTAANTTAYDLTVIDPDGAEYTALYTSDGSATAKEIVEGQKSALDALSITGLVATEDDATLTVTLPLGWTMTFEAPRYATTARTAEVGVLDKFMGFAVFVQDIEYDPANPNSYPANHAMDILKAQGSMFVENADGVSRRDAVYIELAAGDNQGKVYNTNSATRELLPNVLFEENAGDGLATIEMP